MLPMTPMPCAIGSIVRNLRKRTTARFPVPTGFLGHQIEASGMRTDHPCVTLSLPSILGPGGIARIFEAPISDDERQALQPSAERCSSSTFRKVAIVSAGGEGPLCPYRPQP
jgi:malate/lactate dehydrogenase